MLCTGIFGGFLLGVRSNSGLTFYDWESLELIRRIEIQPERVRCTLMFRSVRTSSFWSCFLYCLLQIFWSGSGDLVCIATEECFFVLRYLPDVVSAAQGNKEKMTEGGIEDAFEVTDTVHSVVYIP